MSGTFHELAGLKREIAIYLAIFFLAGVVVDLLDLLRPFVGLVSFVGYFAAQYWLYRQALAKAAIAYDDRFKGFSFFFMAVILIIPIYFGLIFLIVPGILLASKWIMAPTYLVAERMDLFQAIGESWRVSANNLGAIAGTFTVLCFLWFAIAAVLGGVGAAYEGLVQSAGVYTAAGEDNAFSWISFHVLPILLLGLSVTAYRALGDDEASLTAVFE